MSKMIAFRVKRPKGVITIHQVMDVMEAMGLNPECHMEKIRVDSYTQEDFVLGRLRFDTSPIGGIANAQNGILQCEWDENTGEIQGQMDLVIDAWARENQAEELSRNLGKSLQKLVNAISQVANATKQTTYRMPGLTSQEVLEVFQALGGEMATRDLVDGTNTNKTGTKRNLANSYLNRRTTAKLQTLGRPNPKQQADTTDLLRIGNSPKNFTIQVPTPKGKRKEIQLGYVPPVAKLEQVKGGVDVTLPEIFLDECKEMLENIRNLGIALRAAETQAKQHVGKCEPLTEVHVRDGKLTNFSIDWEKPELETDPLSQTAQQRIAQRANLVKKGEVEVSQQEREILFARMEQPKSINTAALKQQVISQAREAGIRQFVYV